MSIPTIFKRQQEELMQIKERLAEIESILVEIMDRKKPGPKPKENQDAKTRRI